MGRAPVINVKTQKQKGVLTAQGLLENEPLRVGTPLSGGRDAIRRWMESPKTQRWVLAMVMQGLCQQIYQ